MSNTLKRPNAVIKENAHYSPLTLPQSPAAGSPQKNLTGSPRIARDIIADLYNNIQHWNDSHVKGALIVKQIAVLKSDNSKSYSPQLEEYANELFNTVQTLEIYRKRFDLYGTQIKALTKLERNSKPLFISLDVESLAKIIATIGDAYNTEYKSKQMVLENIAHSRNKDEVMFYAACWTHQINVTSIVDVKLEALLAETGFRTFI